jgi:hypothetical protein
MPLNINLDINNERRDFKIGTVCGGKRGKEGDEGEGIWWMDFIYFYETEQRHLLQLL